MGRLFGVSRGEARPPGWCPRCTDTYFCKRHYIQAARRNGWERTGNGHRAGSGRGWLAVARRRWWALALLAVVVLYGLSRWPGAEGVVPSKARGRAESQRTANGEANPLNVSR